MRITKKLPIGIEDFEKIRTEGFYYVDKTAFIKDLLNNWGEVNLFTRPRRFGKSLNMSMLKYFFEYGCEESLFEGLEIKKEQELCKKYMGQFPVISVSLKSVSGETFKAARAMLCSIIGREALRFQFLADSQYLSDKEKRAYDQLTAVGDENADGFVMTDSVLSDSLLMLSTMLKKHYGQKVIILIDEYDVPLDKAQQFGYYDSMIHLIRNLFMQALKGNTNLYFAVMTGCLRISKESIFTGLNNPQIFSISDVLFDRYFGFTDSEVELLLSYYNLSEYYDVMKEWYDGYRFGNTDVYCPWDVICHCAALRADLKTNPKNYWSHTSSNDIVKHFIKMARNSTTKREIEKLIAGETVAKRIYQELTYKDLDNSIDNLWSVLFTTGYLTQEGDPDEDTIHLRIPNLEIRKIFTDQIYAWFQESAEQDGKTLSAFCDAVKNGDTIAVEKQFNEYLMKTIGIRDTFIRKQKKENFYHGILLGLFAYKDSWGVSSNKESGEGYSDILIEIEEEEIGIIIEVKYPDSDNLEKGCVEALKQIEKMKYEEVLKNNGMRKILKYGIACHKKHCKVVLG